MKTSLLIVVLISAVGILGCAEKHIGATGDTPVSSEASHMPPLLSALASRYPDAVREVSARLVEEGEDPSEFHAEVEEKEGAALLVFRLAHKNTFLPENRTAVGNPSGKDREIDFDTRTGRASQSLFYQ